MNLHCEQHLQRIRTAIDPSKQAETIASYMCANTLLKGVPFNFRKFGFQKFILDLPDRIKYTRKPSQKGVSELSIRESICFALLNNGVNCMYVMPTAKASQEFSSTRFSTVLDSPNIAANIHAGNNSTTIRRFLNDSFIHMKGASNVRQAISVATDFLTMDEIDFYDDWEIVTSFQSRLAASDYKQERWFSTPTVTGVGVSAGFDSSRRYWPFTKCQRCNHKFIADYYQHVRLPGFSPDSLTQINFFARELLSKYDTDKAYLECPKCGRAVDLLRPDNYEYVCENPTENYPAAGIQVTPFIVGSVVSVGQLIHESTKYKNQRDFVNFSLGLPSEDDTTGLSRVEVEALFTQDVQYPESPPYQICGIDLGGECAVLSGYPAPNGHLRICHVELIPLNRMRARVPELFAQKRIITGVSDSLPYSDLVSQLQDQIPSLFAALYTQTKGMELYTIRDRQEDETKATYGIRQLNVKKNLGFDLVVGLIRSGKISFAPSTLHLKDVIVKHLTDMKRVNIKAFDGGTEFVWKKSDKGADHLFHALLYLVLADHIKGLAGGIPLPFLAGKFKTKSDV